MSINKISLGMNGAHGVVEIDNKKIILDNCGCVLVDVYFPWLGNAQSVVVCRIKLDNLATVVVTNAL